MCKLRRTVSHDYALSIHQIKSGMKCNAIGIVIIDQVSQHIDHFFNKRKM